MTLKAIEALLIAFGLICSTSLAQEFPVSPRYPESPAPPPVVAPVPAPLPSEAYSEGACIEPQVALDVDPNWIANQKTFYVPMASQFAYRRYAETFLSRPPNSEGELQSMCMTAEFLSRGNGVNVTSVGYDDREFKQTCAITGPAKLTCNAMGSSPGVNPSKTLKTDGYIVAIDNRSFMLLVRCVEGFFRDYMLYTTKPSVSLATFSNILNITRNLGFDDRRLQLASYDTCSRFRGINVSLLGELENAKQRVFPPSSALAESARLTAPFARNNEDNHLNHPPSRARHGGYPQPYPHHHHHQPGFGLPPQQYFE